MFVCNLLGGVRDRRFVVEIEPQGLDRNATRGELCHGTLAALRITCAEDNVHTRIAELLRDLPSNSFISACDKRDAGRVGHDFSLTGISNLRIVMQDWRSARYPSERFIDANDTGEHPGLRLRHGLLRLQLSALGVEQLQKIREPFLVANARDGRR